MNLNSETNCASITYAITLIHGTFAKRAPWTMERSKLRQAIARELGEEVQFYQFEWSGKNTDAARIRASYDL
jgi:hypothetical protein